MLRPVLAVLVLTLAAAPLAPAAPLPAQDDAGSGRDAPDAPDASFLVPAGVLHAGVGSRFDTDVYAFHAAAGTVLDLVLGGAPACMDVLRPDGATVASPGACIPIGRSFATASLTLDETGTWYLRHRAYAGGAYRFGFGLDHAAPSLTGRDVGADPTCGTGAPVTATYGDGPLSLVYAALKTGTRAVVAWQTPDLVQATLLWNLSGSPTQALTEASPRTHHVFVLDELPRGATLCFVGPEGEARALSLRNAMHAHDGDAYVLNLLVLANEQPDAGDLAAGLDNYAWRLRDATDGHVKSGKVVVLAGDFDHHNSGWATCTVARPDVAGSPTCRFGADVLFTADALPLGAASTNRDGIQSRTSAIWMNSYWQAGTVNLGDDVGAVLMHEVGHYVFGALDLYVGSGCDVPEKSLSVMSSGRQLTELDDEVNRCPNERQVSGYVPSWTLLRERFPLVPDRAGVIDAGPVTPGDAYRRHTFEILPLATREARDAGQDDAGSGGDAPGGAGQGVPVEPGTWYAGHTRPGDAADQYAFEARAGQRVNVTVVGVPLCTLRVMGADGEARTTTCTLGTDGTVRYSATLPQAGTWFLRVTASGPYRFAFALDAPAPRPAA